MAANRIESGPKSEEPVSEAQAPAAAAPVAGGFKAWLPLLATLLLMPGLAFAMTRFVLLPQLQKGLGLTAHATGEVKSKTGAASPDAKRETVPMSKLLVNVAGTMGARYLLVSLSVEGSDADFKTKIAAHDPQLRDKAMGILRTKTLADLEKPGAANIIRTELISGFDVILGGSLVQNIYLTEFAIQ